MTNNDILRASLLDIVFENRNKEYGAYALRRDYNYRMYTALFIGLGLVFGLILLNGSPVDDNDNRVRSREAVVVTTIELPHDPKIPEKPKEPEKPKQAPKVAQIKYPVIKIVPDEKADKPLPTIDDLAGKKISTVNTDGIPDDGKVKPKEEPVQNTSGDGNTTDKGPADFKGVELQPEFPGGEAAMQRFLSTNLITPEDLSAGEKKTVRIRFKVEKDGSVSSFEIVLSGGDAFDKEVVRVCRRMPRWKPAIQNGVNVPVSYLLPVTFMGVEQ